MKWDLRKKYTNGRIRSSAVKNVNAVTEWAVRKVGAAIKKEVRNWLIN